MRESIGSVFLYNIIILFILITFAFLSGTLSYMKAYKANSRIIHAIEKFEGYNSLSNEEINNVLGTLGYKTGTKECPRREGMQAISKIENSYDYCLYKFQNGNRDFYGVLTYMYFDFPVVGNFGIPLYTKTEYIYRFTPTKR